MWLAPNIKSVLWNKPLIFRNYFTWLLSIGYSNTFFRCHIVCVCKYTEIVYFIVNSDTVVCKKKEKEYCNHAEQIYGFIKVYSLLRDRYKLFSNPIANLEYNQFYTTQQRPNSVSLMIRDTFV